MTNALNVSTPLRWGVLAGLIVGLFFFATGPMSGHSYLESAAAGLLFGILYGVERYAMVARKLATPLNRGVADGLSSGLFFFASGLWIGESLAEAATVGILAAVVFGGARYRYDRGLPLHARAWSIAIGVAALAAYTLVLLWDGLPANWEDRMWMLFVFAFPVALLVMMLRKKRDSGPHTSRS